ncbi:MAG: hypothetical protein WAV08_13160, partial [Desulfobacterales bacterium]
DKELRNKAIRLSAMALNRCWVGPDPFFGTRRFERGSQRKDTTRSSLQSRKMRKRKKSTCLNVV